MNISKVTLYNAKGFPVDIQNVISIDGNSIILNNGRTVNTSTSNWHCNGKFVRPYINGDIETIASSVGFSPKNIIHDVKSVYTKNVKEWNEFNLDVLADWFPSMDGFTAFTYLTVRFGMGKGPHIGGFGNSWFLTTGHPDIFLNINPNPIFELWKDVIVVQKNSDHNVIEDVNPYIRQAFFNLKKSIFIGTDFNIEGIVKY